MRHLPADPAYRQGPAGEPWSATNGKAVFALAVLATLLTLVLLGWLLRDTRRGAPPGGRVDRRRHRARLQRDPREALSLLGNALAATHDPRVLLPVILEVTVEATGAAGGRLLEGDRELSWIGEDAGAAPLRLPLSGGGSGGDVVVVLHPPPGGFSGEATGLARWLVSQAAVALENAALHHVVQHQATTDELTGLANRRRFMELFAAEIDQVERRGTVALVLADLDDFKRINDRFGHHVGDDALRRFAELLVAELRDGDVGGRLGGEEFAVLLPDADLEGALAVAGRIRRAVAESYLFPAEGTRLRFTVSLGVAGYAGETADALFRRADAALYRAKASGKNRVAPAGVV
jgi:diguanylate cyclase (GGDEF)-like protein